MLSDVLQDLRLTAGELYERSDDFHLGTAEVISDISEASVLRFADIG